MAVLTVYPDAHVESTSVDGQAHENTFAAWATIRGAAGDTAADSSPEVVVVVHAHDTASGDYQNFGRGGIVWDASSLADDAIISAATVTFASDGNKTDSFAEAASISMVDVTLASNTAVIAGDYDAFGTTKQASDLPIANMDDDGSYDETNTKFTLNATGLGNISTTVPSPFGFRVDHDNDNNEPTWAGNGRARLQIRSADAGGDIPKMVITYRVPVDYGPFTASLAVGCVESASRAMGYDRDVSLAVGCVESASRAMGYVRAAATLASGMAVAADRSMGYVRGASVLAVGLAVAASRSATYTRAASTLAVGLVVAATRTPGYIRAASTLAVGMVPFSSIREQIKRLRRSVGTNRTTSQVGSNRTNSQVGTNRDMETF